MESPFAGVRMLRDVLRKEGTLIGCKRVRTLMRKMGIQALYPKPRTSERCPVHPVFPYLLRDLIIDRPNPVWATEIVFTQMTKTDVLAARVGRDDITNFDLGIRHDNPIDQKIDPLTLLFEGGINQPPLNAGAELLPRWRWLVRLLPRGVRPGPRVEPPVPPAPGHAAPSRGGAAPTRARG
ncbi:MAG: transposase [Candidatus Competibacteraceae bacterium]|nr:transposase [Candidatus Competibacteraceae bacterium]